MDYNIYIYLMVDYDEHKIIELPYYDTEIESLLEKIFGKSSVQLVVKGNLIKEQHILNKEDFINYLEGILKRYVDEEDIKKLITILV